MGWNLGAKADTVEHLRARLEAIGGGEPVLLVGWSLGGLFAREARAVPDKVRAVVTLGSPFSGDPRQNNVWRLYERIARHPVDQPRSRASSKSPGRMPRFVVAQGWHRRGARRPRPRP